MVFHFHYIKSDLLIFGWQDFENFKLTIFQDKKNASSSDSKELILKPKAIQKICCNNI